MTTSIPYLLLAFASGVGIGGVFFGGLWWTIQRLATAERPACLMLLSLCVRTGFALAALYIIMAGQWERLLAAMMGITLIRIMLLRRLSPQGINNSM